MAQVKKEKKQSLKETKAQPVLQRRSPRGKYQAEMFRAAFPEWSPGLLTLGKTQPLFCLERAFQGDLCLYKGGCWEGGEGERASQQAAGLVCTESTWEV